MEPNQYSHSPCSSNDFAMLAIIKAGDDEAAGGINEGNKTIHAPNPLLNPIVLDLVFDHLPVHELRNARLVCREWDNVGATVLGKRTFLMATKLFRYDGTKLSEPAFVADKLLRRLSISSGFNRFEFDPSVPTETRGEVITKAIAAVPRVARLTEELAVCLQHKSHMTALLKGIRKLKSTNLRSVSLCVNIVDSSWGKKSPVLKKLAVQRTLTSFTFEQQIDDDYAFTVRRSSYNPLTYQPFVQIWLDAAPNLTELRISANFYPNLEGCKSIKVFEFEFIDIPNMRFEAVNLTAVAGMLAHIKNSVVEVSLENSNKVVHYCQKEKLDLPVMPNLVTLFVADIYQVQDSLDEIRLPKLEHLTLDKFYEIEVLSLSTPHKNLSQRHRGIQSVDLMMRGIGECENFSETMVQLFPNVKRFDFTWFVGTIPLEEFSRFLEPFKAWNLEIASLQFRNVKKPASQTILAGLRNMATWQGEKTAKFYFDTDRVDFTAHFDDFIRYSGGFEIVKMRDDSWDNEFTKEMQAIFDARNAPISIK